MTPAHRCPWYLHADVYYTCLQVTIAQKVTQMGMQLSMTLACRCLWHLYDTCTQVSMATARRCLWHLHANTLWSGWCYYNFDTFGYIWLWFIDKLTPRLLAPQNFALQNLQDLMMNWWWTDDDLMRNWWWTEDELILNWWLTDDEPVMNSWIYCHNCNAVQFWRNCI